MCVLSCQIVRQWRIAMPCWSAGHPEGALGKEREVVTCTVHRRRCALPGYVIRSAAQGGQPTEPEANGWLLGFTGLTAAKSAARCGFQTTSSASTSLQSGCTHAARPQSLAGKNENTRTRQAISKSLMLVSMAGHRDVGLGSWCRSLVLAA